MDKQKQWFWLLIVGAIGFISRAGIELFAPAYWRPITILDYSAVILTTLNDVVLGLVLLLMLRIRPIGKGLFERSWGYAIVFAGIGSIVSGLGNLLEDAFKFFRFDLVTQIGITMYLVGGIGSALALLLAFLGALGLPDLRYRWSWFYIFLILAAIILRDFSGFVIGAGMLILTGVEIRDLAGE